jgi:predicted small metal-binding protein
MARVRPTATDIFFERVEACAYLYRADEMDLHEAVDGLQEHAERHGVVSEIGQDAVQTILSEVFRRARTRIRTA